MSRLPSIEDGWFCPLCHILQPIYQRCSLCGTVFELHCGRVGVCLRYSQANSPLSIQGVCRNCRNRYERPGPSGGGPPPPSAPGGGDSGRYNYPSGGFQQQQHHQQHRNIDDTYRTSRQERSQGRWFSPHAPDNDSDEMFIGIGTGYGTPGDVYNGWWCCVKEDLMEKNKIEKKEEVKSVLEVSTKNLSIDGKSAKSPTKKSKKNQPDNEDDNGESLDDGGGRKHKVPTTPEK